MEALGAYTQQDLLDLELEDYELLEMRPLKLKRFEQMISALEEEFDAPPPGQELTEENMTRRQWRKAQSEKYGFEMGKSTSEIGAVSSAQKAAKKLHSKSLGARSFPERKW